MGTWQGLERATGTVLKTGMNLMELDQKQQSIDSLEADRALMRRNQEEQMKMQKEEADRNNKILEMQIKEKEYNSAPVNIKARLAKMGITEQNEIAVLSRGLEADIENVEGDDYVPRSIAMKHFEQKLKDPMTLAELATIKIQNANAKKQQLQAMLKEGKLKPEEQQQIKKELDSIPVLQERYLAAKKRAEMQLKNYGTDDRNDIAEKRLDLEERRVAAMENRGAGGEPDVKLSEQKKNKTVDRIDDYIKTYEKIIAERPDDSSYAKEQLKIAHNAKNYVLNGGDPDQIIWGGGSSKKQSVKKQSVNINQERKLAKEAIAAGKDKAIISRKFKARTGQDL